MPRVPSYGSLQVTPTVQPTGALEPVTPQMHKGAANSLKALATAGQGLSEYAMKAFEQANKTRAQDAINSFTSDLQGALYGQDGLMRRKGKDVAENDGQTSFSDQGLAKFDEYSSKHAEGLNPQQLKLYNEFLTKKRNEVSKTLLDHEIRENNAYTVDVETVRVEQATSQLALNGGDRESRAISIEQIRESTKTVGSLQGWSNEKIKWQSEKAVSGALRSVVTALLENGDVDAANALFVEEGKAGNFNGSDTLYLRKVLEKATKEKLYDNSSKVIAKQITDDHDVNYLLADQLIERGYTTPELEKKLENVTDPIKRRDIYARQADYLIKKAGGDLLRACQMAVVGEHIQDEGLEVLSKDAEVMAGKINIAPDARTRITESDVQRYIIAKHPGLDSEDLKKLVKKTKDEVDLYLSNRDLDRKSDLLKIRDRILNVPNGQKSPSLDELDTSRLTEKQYQDAKFFSECASKGQYDTALEETLRTKPSLVKSMSEADFESSMLRIRPQVAQWLRSHRDYLKDENTKSGPTNETIINDVFNERIASLGLDGKEHRQKVNVLRNEFERKVREETANYGAKLTRDQVKQLLITFPLPKVFKQETMTMFESSKALQSSSEGYSAAKSLAELAGWSTASDENIVVFVGRLMAGDKEINELPIVDVKSLFPHAMRIKFQKEIEEAKRNGKFRPEMLDANSRARWLIANLYEEKKVAPVYEDTYTGIYSENIQRGND